MAGRVQLNAGTSSGVVNASVILDSAGLDALVRNTDGNVENAIEKLAQDAAGWAAQNIRDVHAIDTSYMVNTTQARRLGPMAWSIGTLAFYGFFIEYGTRFMGARPWLIPAMNKARATLEAVLRNALKL